MQQPVSIFALFGGVRPMARELDEPASNVYAWERADRIPTVKQSHVLKRGIALGLPITPELVIYPSGDVPDVVVRAIRAQHSNCTACDHDGLNRASSVKYGNRGAVLDNSAHMVAA